jgi:transcriptional regulator with XRE-family HTH domain
MHRNYIGAIERGEINPTFRVLLKLAAGLGIPLSALIDDYETVRREGY